MILHELNQLELGGAERVVLNIAAGDPKRHMVVAYRDGPMRKEFEEAGVEVVVVTTNRELGRFLDEPPDIELAHIHTGGHDSAIARTCSEWWIPVVETIHAPVASVVRDSFVTTRVCCSAWVAEKNPGSVVIHNGVDDARLIRERMGREYARDFRLGIAVDYEQPQFLIGWLGRIIPCKGLESILEVAAELSRYRDDVEVALVGPVVKEAHGVGDLSEFEPDLRAYAQQLGVKLHLPGPQNPGLAMPAFDVFLHMSEVEAMPLVLVEAMLCGVPICCRDLPVNHEVCGEFATYSGPVLHEFAAAVVEASRSTSKWREVGRQFALQEFSVEAMRKKYDELYAKALAR